MCGAHKPCQEIQTDFKLKNNNIRTQRLHCKTLFKNNNLLNAKTSGKDLLLSVNIFIWSNQTERISKICTRIRQTKQRSSQLI